LSKPQPQPQAQAKTQSIVDELNILVLNCVKLNGFKAAQMKRDIAHLPDQRHREIVMSYYYVAIQDYVSFYDSFLSFKRRLQLVDSFEYVMYGLMLRIVGRLKESFDLLIEGSEVITSPIMLSHLISQSVIGLDVKSYKIHIDKLIKINAVENVSKAELDICYREAADLNSWIDKGLTSEEQLIEIANIINKIANKFSLFIRANIIDINEHDEWLNISYVLCENSTSQHKLFEINDYLFDEMIKSNLDEMPGVLQFIRSPNSAILEHTEALVNAN
jgi:hypothetical protein